MSDTREYISNLDMPEKVTLFKELYNELAGYGIEGDTELAHVNTFEASLLKSLGGSGTLNDITNLREYKGGGGSPPPAPPAQQSVTQTSEFPTELKPFIKDILTEGQTEFQREQAEGFQTFPGPQLAQFTPEQQAAFAAGREQFTGLAGTPLARAGTYYQPALAATALGTAEIGAEDIGRRMDPFLQNVVDIAKREARSDEDLARQQRAAKAVAGQGFLVGTRPAFVEVQAGQDLAERLGDIQARGLSASFQQAQQAAEQQRAREMTGGRQFAALGDATGARARSDISGLAGIGETQQQRSQQALDIAQREFEQERAFPQTALQRYASLIRGFPLQATQQQFATQTIPTPSFAQTLAGLGQTAAGTYGMFGGFRNQGGLVSLQEGGQPVGSQFAMGDPGGAATTPMPTREQFPNQANTALEMLRRRGAAIRQASVPQVPQVPMPVQDPRLNRGAGVNLARNEGGLLSVVNRNVGGSALTPMEDLQLSMQKQDPLYATALEQILAQPSREKLLGESREHWRLAQERADERLQRADELKKQRFWAGLAASGAGTLAADPRKGVWGAVGEGFQAGLPTWAEGMSEYAAAEERAAEREEDILSEKRSEELGLDRHDLETTIQKLRVKEIGTKNKKEAAEIEAVRIRYETELKRLDFDRSFGQLAAFDTVGTIEKVEYGLYGDKMIGARKEYISKIVTVAENEVRRQLKEMDEANQWMPGQNEIDRMIDIEVQKIIDDWGRDPRGRDRQNQEGSARDALSSGLTKWLYPDLPDQNQQSTEPQVQVEVDENKEGTMDLLKRGSPFHMSNEKPFSRD